VFSQFKVIGINVKEVYEQLDTAFNRTCRERADLLVYMGKTDDELKELKLQSEAFEDKMSQFESLTNDFVAGLEMQLALEFQDEIDRQ